MIVVSSVESRLACLEGKVDLLVSEVHSIRSDLFTKVLLPMIVVIGGLAGIDVVF